MPAASMESRLIAFEIGPRGDPLFWAAHIAHQRAALAAVAAGAGVDVDTPVMSGLNPSTSIEYSGPGPGEVAFFRRHRNADHVVAIFLGWSN